MTALAFAFVWITLGGTSSGVAKCGPTLDDCRALAAMYEAEGMTTSEPFALGGSAPMPHVMEGV